MRKKRCILLTDRRPFQECDCCARTRFRFLFSLLSADKLAAKIIFSSEKLSVQIEFSPHKVEFLLGLRDVLNFLQHSFHTKAKRFNVNDDEEFHEMHTGAQTEI